MKTLPEKDIPAVTGGVKPGQTGDCTSPTSPVEYPQNPTVPTLPDPEFTDPASA